MQLIIFDLMFVCFARWHLICEHFTSEFLPCWHEYCKKTLASLFELCEPNLRRTWGNHWCFANLFNFCCNSFRKLRKI